METMTNGVMPVFDMADRNRDDGFGGGNWIWIILLFFIFGGNGFGNRAGESAAMGQITNDFLYTNLNGTIDRGFNQLSNQSFGLSKELCEGFGGVQRSFQTLGSQMAECCCETNRNIDAVRYENAKNTCDIITAQNAGTQRIIDQLTQNEINSLRSELQSAQLALSNTAQTQNIIGQLQPIAKPAYLTCSPYYAQNGCGCGC